MEEVDRCCFCGKLSQYNFTIQTPVCEKHWHMMWKVEVPNYISASQILTFKKLAVKKQLWKE
jgi:hypothetical protein